MGVLMMFFRTTTGIELGETDLTIAVVRNTFGKTRLIGVRRLDGFVKLDENERRKTLEEALKAHRIPGATVYLSLPRDQGIVRQIQLPVELKRKLPDIIKIQIETLSPWPVTEIYWDFAVEVPKKDQKLMTITIVIIPRTFLDPWIVFFKSAGLPLSGATLSSVARGHGISALWNEARPTIVLHREASYTEGTLINGSQLAAFTGPPVENDFAPTAVIDRLLSAVRMSSSNDSRVWVSGKVENSAVENNPRLPLQDVKPESTKEFGSIATALMPLKQSPFKSNLVPAELRYHESRRRLMPAVVMGVLVFAMSIGLFLREPYQNAIYGSELNTEIRKVSPKIKEVADQEKELDQLSQRFRALTSQIQSHDRVLESVGELARVLPGSTFVTNYSYQDGTITISGFAQSASEIQSLLEGSPLFKGVEFTNSVTREASGKDRFTLKMVLEDSK
jgi:Tfp pilus assembly protein PilN